MRIGKTRRPEKKNLSWRKKDMNDRPDSALDIDELLHPANAFGHPFEVVNDPDLTLNEKRAILASWASDACAIEATPELRATPQAAVVRFDDVIDALRILDKQVTGDECRRELRRSRIYRRRRRRGESDRGSPPQ